MKPSDTPNNTSRRQFLTKSASSAFGFTFIPAYLTSARAQNNPKKPPSQRINLGCIGVGGRGASVVSGICKQGNAMPVALCDVDHNRGAKIIKAHPDAKAFHDFREMFDKMGKDIDAVSVGTPDHTHFTAAIHAMSLGKHVYVEKPLTHTFEEAEILMRGEKKFKVVTQMGNQGHTSGGSEQFKRMVAGGVVDDIVKVEAWKSPSLWFMNAKQRIKGFPKEEAIPESLKTWDLWCGPQEMKGFSKMFHPFDWRGFHLYGGGMFGDWGCHIIDFIHHYLKLGYPTEINPTSLEDYNKVSFPLSSHINLKFPARGDKLPAVDMMWKAGGDYASTIDAKYLDPNAKKAPNLGGAGTLLHRKQGDYLVHRNSHGSGSKLISAKKRDDLKAAMDSQGPKFDNMESFTQACMGNGKTDSPFSVAGVLTQVLTLGVIAEYLNVKLKFDPKTKKFIGNEEANGLLSGPAPRKEWAGHYKLA
ncbi:Gfo/Idh/MocA family oxidoreductase [Akkermansiaceae bacterium]|nr:Gfo/Idh/MocA family oxidoreductase [Akkermansiaceae bacterium]MDA7888598.1 Gfo/Idh/MocA family oxidoreductase [Akkermansiaceae bacterium]